MKMFHLTNIKSNFLFLNTSMINLLLDELKLIAQTRKISDYENKSEKDLVKALSKSKPKRNTKLKIGINKKKLGKIFTN